MIQDSQRLAENEIARSIYKCAIEAHRNLCGPGLLESIYEEALEWELKQCGLLVGRQVPCPVIYKGPTYNSFSY
jgi:GxxExxY protein